MKANPLRTETAINRVMERLRHIDTGEAWGPELQTEFRDLDKITGGLKVGDLWVIGGRPSMGKSSLMWNIVENICVDGGTPTIIVTQDGPVEELLWRLVFSRAALPLLKDGQCWLPNESSRLQLEKAALAVRRAKLFVDDRNVISLDELFRNARTLKKDEDLGLLMIDDFHSLKGREKGAALKELAKELQIPVLVLCDLNRGPEERRTTIGVPYLGDMRTIGALERNADKVVLIYRPSYYAESLEEQDQCGDTLKLHLRKNLRGEIGSMLLNFDKTIRRYSSLEGCSWKEHD